MSALPAKFDRYFHLNDFVILVCDMGRVLYFLFLRMVVLKF